MKHFLPKRVGDDMDSFCLNQHTKSRTKSRVTCTSWNLVNLQNQSRIYPEITQLDSSLKKVKMWTGAHDSGDL